MKLRAVIYSKAGAVRMMIRADAATLNANLAAGETWRELPPKIENPRDAPPASALPSHALLREIV